MVALRRRIALVLINLAAGLMVLGGVGDILVGRPPAVWDAVAGTSLSDLPPGVSRLLLALLGTLGSAIIGAGIVTIIVVNGPLRRGERWASVVIILLVLLSEGSNAVTMLRLGVPYFWAPLSFVAVVLIGLGFAHVPTPVFGPRAPMDDRGPSLNGAA